MSFMYELDRLNGLLAAFRQRYCYTWYYLAHKIEKDDQVRNEYERLLTDAESLLRLYPNAMSKCFLALVYRMKCKTDETLKSVQLLEESASEDYAYAHYHLARCYQLGVKYSKNYNKTVELLSKASAAGILEATAKLGDAYYFGDGVSKSIEQAFKLYSQSYNGGKNVFAVEGLAFVYNYAHNHNYKRDVDEARRLYLTIIDKSVEAVRILGTTYLSEDSPSPSVPLAIKYLEQAADRGDCKAAEALARIHDGTDWAGTRSYYSPDKNAYWENRYNVLKGYMNDYVKGRNGEPEGKAGKISFLYIAFYIVMFIVGWNVIKWLWRFIVSIPNRIFDFLF